MKNLRISKKFLAIVTACLSLSVFSCKDELSNVPPLNQVIKDPFKYTLDNLTTIGKGVLNSSKNNDFRKMVYSEIEKRFDGDEDVLIKTLEENASRMNVSLVQNIAKSMRNSSDALVSAGSVLRAFSNIEGNEYYPQVYIPFFEELKRNGKIGTSTPTIVIFNGDSKDSKQNGAPGYIIDSEGDIKQIANVKEDYAKNNEVWVISLNERTVKTPQGIKLKKELVNNLGSAEKKSRTMGVNDWEWQIKKMKIKVDFDNNFLMGDSEVCMKAVVDHYPLNSGVSSGYLYSPYGGYLFLGSFSVGNEQTNNTDIVKTHKSSNFFKWGEIVGNDSDNGSRNMYHVIYEDDNWPAVERTATFDKVGGGVIEIRYRSEDLYYSKFRLDASEGPLFASNYVTDSGPWFMPRIIVSSLDGGYFYNNSLINYTIAVKP
jgi:hypothetical protein